MCEPEGGDQFSATGAHGGEADSVLFWSGRGNVVLRLNVLFLSATPPSVALETLLPKNEGLEVMGNSGLLWVGQQQAHPTVHSCLLDGSWLPGFLLLDTCLF